LVDVVDPALKVRFYINCSTPAISCDWPKQTIHHQKKRVRGERGGREGGRERGEERGGKREREGGGKGGR